MATNGAGRYLGFDLSTQSCKAVVVGEDGKVQHIARVVFDEDLPTYETSGGVHRGDDGKVTSPATMWCEALELAVQRLADLTDLSDIVAVSGSGQQHATVYLSETGVTALEALDPARPLVRQFDGCFARASPVWLDTSTGQECAELEEAAGGAMALSALTGSRAYERFSVHLIRQTFGRLGVSWSDCSHIALASSFGASLLAGKRVPIDHSDAAGMNLMDLSTRRWSEKLVNFVGGDLPRVLPEPIPAWTKCGRTAAFWKKFKLDAEAVAWSGDNPCAVVGLGLLEVGDIAISLGTSDTCLAVIPGVPAEPLPFGHIFPHPTLDGKFWSMLCYTNGDLMRKKVRDDYAGGDWDKFSALLADTPPGNDGLFGYFTVTNEITPALAVGEPVFRRDGKPVEPTAAEAVPLADVQHCRRRDSSW
jgi:xylulokinase